MGLAAFRRSSTVRAFIVHSVSFLLRPTCAKRPFRGAAFRGPGAGALTTDGFSAAFFAAHLFFNAADSRLRPAGGIPPGLRVVRRRSLRERGFLQSLGLPRILRSEEHTS